MTGCIHTRFKWIMFPGGGYEKFDFCAIDGHNKTKKACTVTQCSLHKNYECTCPEKLDSYFLDRYWNCPQQYRDLNMRLQTISLKQDGCPGATIVKPGKEIQTLPITPEVLKKSLESSRLDNIGRAKVKTLLDQAESFKAPEGTICFECGEPVNGSHLKIMVYDIDFGAGETEPRFIGTAWICADYPECWERRLAKQQKREYIPLSQRLPKLPKIAKQPERIARQVNIFEV